VGSSFAGLHAATKRQEELLRALEAAGWTADFDSVRLWVVTQHPANGIEMPTPDYVTQKMWPGETYRCYRAFTLLFRVVSSDTIKIHSVIRREHPAPWVGASIQPITLTKAIALVAEPHPAELAGVAHAKEEVRP
jgi:hypothetical protein